jgi:hypothetical protein
MGMATTHEMPEDAEFLSFQVSTLRLDPGELWAWFIAPKNSMRMRPRKFKLFGTGQDIPYGFQYLGTAQTAQFVWHLFEERDADT